MSEEKKYHTIEEAIAILDDIDGKKLVITENYFMAVELPPEKKEAESTLIQLSPQMTSPKDLTDEFGWGVIVRLPEGETRYKLGDHIPLLGNISAVPIKGCDFIVKATESHIIQGIGFFLTDN